MLRIMSLNQQRACWSAISGSLGDDVARARKVQVRDVSMIPPTVFEPEL